MILSMQMNKYTDYEWETDRETGTERVHNKKQKLSHNKKASELKHVRKS